MRRFLLTLSLAVILAGPNFAKNSAPPDISGTWVLNLKKSKLAKGTNIRSETIVILCSGSRILMRDKIDGKESTVTYFVDGKEHPFAEVQDGRDEIKVHWKKSILVVETFARLRMPDSPLNGSKLWHLRDRWSLSADGRVLTEKSEGFESTSVLVYDKQ